MRTIRNNFQEMTKVLEAFSTDKNFALIEKAAFMMSQSIQSAGKIISCGNGGSMADAMHFAEEMTGRFREDRPALPAIAISDSTHISCVGNDYGYEFIFERFVEAFGKENDVLLAISTSGNSKNVILAAEKAKEKQMKIIGLTGKSGGKLAELCDVEIRVPHFGFADRIQEIHIKIIHTFIQLIEKEVFGEA